MKKTLFPHQIAAMEMMETREREKRIVHSTYCIDLILSIYADMTGYGKTVTMIGLMLRDKMTWDLGQEHIQSCISGVYGNGCIVKRSLLSLRRINTNLIVAGSTIIRQWMEELGETTLRYVVVTSRKKVEQVDPSEYEVVLCSPAFYNYLLERFPSYAWKRFIYDEPTHTKIASMRQIIAGFIWFITATPDLLLNQQRYSHNFMSSIFTNYMDYSLYKNLILKNEDDFVTRSFQLPALHHQYHTCHQPVFNIVKDLISTAIIEMISAGNIEGAVRCLGGNSTSNIFDLIEKDMRDSIQQAEWKITRFERIGDETKVQKWREREDRLRKQLEELQDRIRHVLLYCVCPICLEKKEKPILLTCCQNMFCGECVLQWFQEKSSCPLCRRHITNDYLIYIPPESVQDMSEERSSRESVSPTPQEERIPSKIDTIFKILRENPTGKFIIFSSFYETFDLIRETLHDRGIEFGEIRGTMASREKVISDFKEKSLNVLFLNSHESGAGLNLQEATDIIMFHSMSEPMFTQVRGRAYRIGRTLPLTIHHLQ